MKEFLKRRYEAGKMTQTTLEKLVGVFITQAEFEEIMGGESSAE